MASRIRNTEEGIKPASDLLMQSDMDADAPTALQELHTKKKKFDFTLLRVLRTLPPRGRFLKSRAEPLSKGADKHSLHPMGTHWSSGLNP